MAGGSRSGAREAVAAALATGYTVASAAQSHSVSESTVYRWLRDDPAFAARVAELRAEAVGSAVAFLGTASRKAADTLAGLLGADTPPGIRLQAARSILELALKGREVLEVEKRLAALERSRADDKATRRGA